MKTKKDVKIKHHLRIERKPRVVKFEWQGEILYDELKIQKMKSGFDEKKREYLIEKILQIQRIEKKLKWTAKIEGKLRKADKKLQRKFILEMIQKCRNEIQKAENRLKRLERIQKIKKKIIDIIREENSRVLFQQKKQKEEERKALKEGRFEEVRDSILKEYFSPRFGKCIVLDKSNEHRAVLFAELEYWKSEGLVPTGNVYLCGIDDNGEEWGIYYRISVGYEYDYVELKEIYYLTVPKVMAEIWGVSLSVIENSKRQGEILFYPVEPYEEQLIQEDEWQVRPSHVIKSKGLRHNDNYIESENPIVVEHPTHKPLYLEPGAYKVFWYEPEGD